jgi:hypothetical protein
MPSKIQFLLHIILGCIFGVLFSSCSSGLSSQLQVNEIPRATEDSSLCAKNGKTYLWPKSAAYSLTLCDQIGCPPGYQRIQHPSGNFGNWLRTIPVLPSNSSVLLYNGQAKYRQDIHAAILNIDIGAKDLQQCADAVMRLRAEYLYSQKRFSAIVFTFTSGDPFRYSDYRKGIRPQINGNEVSFSMRAAADTSYAGFRKYMDIIFNYCGTYSLNKEMIAAAGTPIEAGQVFIKGGFPGHAVIIMDVAENEKGERIFLLAQSYMPAQSIHVLINPNNSSISPWYSVEGALLETPEWDFDWSMKKKFD